MTTCTSVMAHYANGVFTPMEPVSVPENTDVQIVVRVISPPTDASPAPGSRAARLAFAQWCHGSQFKSGRPRPTREELYDRH